VVSQLLDTIPLASRYAHDISERRHRRASLPQEVKNKKRKIYVQTPSCRLRRLRRSLAGGAGAFRQESRPRDGRSIDDQDDQDDDDDDDAHENRRPSDEMNEERNCRL